jgi:hypothetical protein
MDPALLRFALHGVLHVAVPGVVARLAWPARWLRAWGLLVLTNLVDLDHLLADPITDPQRCSIGFHPLHAWPAVVAWIGLAAWPRTRILGVGLSIHMALDALDCVWMR